MISTLDLRALFFHWASGRDTLWETLFRLLLMSLASLSLLEREGAVSKPPPETYVPSFGTQIIKLRGSIPTSALPDQTVCSEPGCDEPGALQVSWERLQG